MKKLFLSLFVAGAISFGLQSCSKDTDECEGVVCPTGEICKDGTCVTDPANQQYNCVECATYNNEATGHLNVAGGAVIDTTWGDTTNPDPLTLKASFIQTGSEYTLSVDLSTVSELLVDPIIVEGTYNTTTKVFTVSNFPYNVAGIAEVVVNGNANFSTANSVTGNLVIKEPSGALIPVDGELDFTGTKE